MVRAEFEIPLAEGSWEDAIEVFGESFSETLENDSEAEARRIFDHTLEARRFEDWIAFNLEESGQLPSHSSSSLDLLRKLDRLDGFTQPHDVANPKHQRATKRRANLPELWRRFQLFRRRGVVVLRLIDRSLVKDDRIEELATDLFDLIDAGNDRIILNFGEVERLGSLIANVLSEAQRKCAAVEGGSLRICLLQAQLAGIVALPGLDGALVFYPDEASALEAPWPARPSPKALPIEILSFLKLDMKQSEPRPKRHGGRPLVETRVDPPFVGPPSVWLIQDLGEGKMRSIGVDKSRFIIGREHECDLLVDTAHVSKRHAAIERRGGLNFVRDMGSRNGTKLNERVLRNQDAEIQAGDRIQIGDRKFIVSSSPRGTDVADSANTGEHGESIIEWVRDDRPAYSSAKANAQTLPDFSVSSGPSNPPKLFKHEVIEGVLIITPRIEQLADETAVSALRTKLGELFDQPLPRQVVVSLEFVSQLSPQAIGAILAHQLRLERAGGGLRLCNASYKLMAILDRIHFNMLMECYPMLDDAILIAWD